MNSRLSSAYFRRFFLLAACLFLFAGNVAGVPRCEKEICIDLEHLPGKIQFCIPPTEIYYVLDLPRRPSTATKVYIHLMRQNNAGEFESISSISETMESKQLHLQWDPRKTPNKKNGDRFVLAATLDGTNQSPRSVSRNFSIKWGKTNGTR
jgi:hypothetical protein